MAALDPLRAAGYTGSEFTSLQVRTLGARTTLVSVAAVRQLG